MRIILADLQHINHFKSESELVTFLMYTVNMHRKSGVMGATPLQSAVEWWTKERLRPSHWFGLVPCFIQCFYTDSLVKGQPACKKAHYTNPQRFSFEKGRKRIRG